jgi:hypothetical protein
MTARATRADPQSSVNGPLTRRFTRLEPRDGLVIDAEAWQVAHAYHDQASACHNLAAHGAGVLAGLEVVPAAGREVGVLPGVGIDPQGRLLVVPSPVRFEIDPSVAQAGRAIIVLASADGDADDDGRVQEDVVVQAVAPPADPSAIELARIDLGAQGSFRFPNDPRRPQPGEIDIRFRALAGGHARGVVTVADLVLSDAGDGHENGGALLARAINSDGQFRARYAGSVTVGDALPDVNLLYVSGSTEFAIGDGLAGWLRGFIQGGGMLIGDGCHSTPADQFGAAFDRLAKAVGRQLKRVVTGDQLLWSHHIFGAPPPGLVKTDVGLILAGGGVVYCASDYGCILAGGGEPPAPRPAIKAVEEFATNLAASARERAFTLSFVE